MEIVKNIALILHFVGMAGLIGGFMAQLRVDPKTVTRTMMDGAWTMLASALVLAGTAHNSDDFNPTKLGIKAVILVVILILLISGKRKESLDSGTFYSVGLLAVTNVAIAVLL